MVSNSESGGRLFFAVLPDAATASRIHRLAGVLKRAHEFERQPIDRDRLHVSLLSIGGFPDLVAQLACQAAAKVRMQPFELSFNRTVSFQGGPGNIPFVLVGDDGMKQLKALAQALGAAMARNGLRRLANRDFTPHVTLLYSERRVDEHPIEPIRWTVNEFVLIYSKRGHVHLGRWPLQEQREAVTEFSA